LDRCTHISSRQVSVFLEEAERAGVDADGVLRSLGFGGLTRETISSHTAFSLIDFFRIQGEVARQLDDLTAHLSERKLTFETGAFVTTQLDRSTTLCDAISDLAKHFNMMHGEHYNRVRITDRTATLIIDDTSFPYTLRDDQETVHFVGECVLIQVFCLLDSLSGGLAAKALQRIALKRPSMEGAPPHLNFWTAPTTFGNSAYELSFDLDLAHSPMAKTGQIDLSSEGIFARVISYLEAQSPQSEIQSYQARTLDLIRNGISHQDMVAHRLSISVATLRRRLEEEGTSFRHLVNEHRMAEAVTLLDKGYSISHVSEALNYSDIRAFNRAFKRWKGETPARFARRSENA